MRYCQRMESLVRWRWSGSMASSSAMRASLASISAWRSSICLTQVSYSSEQRTTSAWSSAIVAAWAVAGKAIDTASNAAESRKATSARICGWRFAKLRPPYVVRQAIT